MFPKKLSFLVPLAALLGQIATGAYHLIELDIAVDPVAETIEFTWERNDSDGPDLQISRRFQGETTGLTWTLQATLPRETESWTDTSVTPGLIYEYQFLVPTDEDFPHETAAYVSCGIEAPLIDERGIVLLVVEDSIAGNLNAELQRFEMDLAGDGWTVQRLNFGRDEDATPEELRGEIQLRHAATPLSSIVLFGRLPIVTSGLINPDEHLLYRQATDLFYADVDGVWTDTLSTNEPDQPNYYPDDGHYDQVNIPGPNHRIEIPIGRIDLAEMEAWTETESELLRRYLEKNHNFRHLRYTVPREGYFTSLAFDESPIEAAAVVAMLGTENYSEVYDNGEFEQSRPFLWGIAGRDWNGANYPNYRFKSQFTVNFLSGKQAWQWENNQMRAMLAMPWYGLTCCWGVRPNWFFHHTGMGETIGYSNFRTVNNNDNANPAAGHDYLPVDELGDQLDGYVHINLMGDPTLRIHPVAPARNPTAAPDESGVELTWIPANDNEVVGYHLYTSTNARGPYSRLTTAPLNATTYRHEALPLSMTYYMIRSVKLETSPVGSYWNAGQGVFCQVAPNESNTPPTAHPLNLTVTTPTPFTVTGSDSDGDTLTYTAASNTSHGEVTGQAPNFLYTPKVGFEGSDSFQFNVWDGVNETVGTITFTVEAADSLAERFLAWQASIDWLDKDSSAQGDPDHNGLSNEWEFYLSRDPLAQDGGLYSRMDTEFANNEEYLIIEFKQRSDIPELEIQFSNGNLNSWHTLQINGSTVTREVLSSANDGEEVRLRILLNNDAPRGFLRFAIVPD